MGELIPRLALLLCLLTLLPSPSARGRAEETGQEPREEPVREPVKEPVEEGTALEIRVAPGELEAALAGSPDGATLRLTAGVHRGGVTIDHPLHLVGEAGAVLAGEGRGTVLTLAADGITVRGLTVRGGGADLFEDDAILLLAEAREITVEDCRIEARAFGIYLRAGGGHSIVDNEVRGDASLPVSERGNGIHLWHSVDNEIRGNRLADVRDGVYLSFAHDNLIAGNVGADLRYGIHYMYSERNTLRANRFSTSSGGIALMFSMRNTIEGNETVGNEAFGILCQQLEASHLTGNRVAGNGRGFYIENSAGNRFVANVLAGNGVGAYFTAGSEGNLLTANHFRGNLVQVFEDHPGANTFSVAGRGNFWGDYAGFDWDGDGVGETPYRLRTTASALMARQPLTRWFWMSPVLSLLDWWDTRLLTPEAGSFDPFPLLTDGPAGEGGEGPEGAP